MRHALAVLVVCLSGSALADGRTSEVLVGTTATRVPAATLSFRGTMELQNLGPQPIWCAFSQATAVIGKSRRIGQGDTWSVNSQNFTVWCITSVAQVSSAATIASEVEG